MKLEIYKEIKIFPNMHYGFSVENYRRDVGGQGITIESFDFVKGHKQNIQGVYADKQTAVAIAKAILELCGDA
jgi:uncharacterized radical SAM superfamily protein